MTFYTNGLPVNVFANGLSGEIRLTIHGSRSVSLAEAEARLELEDFQGHDIGDAGMRNLHGGESLVVPFTTPFHFFASLDVIAGNGQLADFGSTGTISLILPEGYTFKSSSGVLLSAVPELETYALMLAGLGLMGVMIRRRG